MTNEQLVSRIKAGIDTADNMLQLWQQNTGFVAKIAMKYQGYEEMDDLMQEGYIGLCHAVEVYDPAQGVLFINYAAFWIRQQIGRYVASCGTVRIPEHARSQIREYKKLLKEFEICIGRRPTDREICLSMGVRAEQLTRIRKDAEMAQIGSLDSPIGEGGENTLADLVADPASPEKDVLDRIQQEQLAAVIWPMVDSLSNTQSKVLRMRYQEGLTLKEAGERLGCHLNNIREHERTAFRELRRPSRAHVLRSFLYDDVIYNRAIKGCGVARFNQTWTSSTERAALGKDYR